MTAEELIKDKKIKFVNGNIILPEGDWDLNGNILKIKTAEDNLQLLYCVSDDRDSWVFRYKSENSNSFFNNGEQSGRTTRWDYYHHIKDVNLIYENEILDFYNIVVLNNENIKIYLKNNTTLNLSSEDLTIKLK